VEEAKRAPPPKLAYPQGMNNAKRGLSEYFKYGKTAWLPGLPGPR